MLWKCSSDACGALFAPGAHACPQCGGTSYRQAPGGKPEGETLTCPPPAVAEPESAAAQAVDEPTAQAPAEPAPKKKPRPSTAAAAAEPAPTADAPAAG